MNCTASTCCTASVPNSLSNDPRQNINCVLDHYDYLLKLVGADGKNIIRGLIARGHSAATITKFAGQNAIDLLRRTIG